MPATVILVSNRDLLSQHSVLRSATVGSVAEVAMSIVLAMQALGMVS